MLSTFIKLLFSIKIFVFLFLGGRLRQVLLYNFLELGVHGQNFEQLITVA